MKKFLIKLLLFSVPIYGVIALAMIVDPYHVFPWHRDEIIINNVGINTRLLKTDYLKNRRPKDFTFFIFGSSRAGVFRTDDIRHLNPLLRPYNYYVDGETLEGIQKRLAFVIRQGYQVTHAIILLDIFATTQEISKMGLIFMEPPWFSERSWAYFYLRHMLLFSQIRSVNTILFNDQKQNNHRFDIRTGDNYFVDADKLLESDSDSYYRRAAYSKFPVCADTGTFPPIVGGTLPRIIDGEIVERLKDIKETLDENHIAYKILFPPIFHKQKLHPSDNFTLTAIFGQLYDFSGENEITTDFHNYYEADHYRPHIARRILQIMFDDGWNRNDL